MANPQALGSCGVIAPQTVPRNGGTARRLLFLGVPETLQTLPKLADQTYPCPQPGLWLRKVEVSLSYPNRDL